MKQVTVSVPGKLMLMGEHAVVYGRPCIVTAVSQRMQVTIEKIDETIFRLNAADLHLENYQRPLIEVGKGDIPNKVKFVEIALRNFVNNYRINSGLNITTKAEFSAKFGFGSSSATVVGMIRALVELFNLKLSNKELFDLSYKTVLDIQRKGSGFDVAAAIYGGTLYFETGGKVIEPLSIDGLTLVAGFTGVKADTVAMVNLVSAKIKNYKIGIEKIFDNIAKLVDEAKIAISDKDWQRLGTLMDYNQNYLEDLGVSTDKLNLMIEAAKKGGAYGAKISGAGGGDCMIALVSNETKEQVKDAIKNVGGEIIDTNINAEGVKIESNS